MELKEYFLNHKGNGILSTADDKGIANAAIYATPHSMEDGTVAFIMRENTTYANISVNPHACFLFIETGKMEGKRIYLTKVNEEMNTELLFSLRRHCKHDECQKKADLHLVFFKINKILPLI